jgi:hypothetical protein
MQKNTIYLLFSALLFILFFTFMIQQKPSISSITIHASNNTFHQDHFPYTLDGNGREFINFNFILYKNTFDSSIIKVIPDDCVESLIANGKQHDISHLKGRCNWKKGVKIDLKNLLHDGENQLQITVLKKDGVGGLNVFGLLDPNDPMLLLTKSLTIGALIVFLILLTSSTLSMPIAILFALATAVNFHYFSYTDYSDRAFDLLISTGHLDYIKMISEGFQLPNPTQGWEYHQPPLYYLCAAIVYSTFKYIGLLDPLIALQLFSLILFSYFFYYALLILKLLLSDRTLLILASILLLFWPSGIIHSVRIGNDSV